jgi:hypothetical protein
MGVLLDDRGKIHPPRLERGTVHRTLPRTASEPWSCVAGQKLLAQLREAGQLTPAYLNNHFLESSVRYYAAPK